MKSSTIYKSLLALAAPMLLAACSGNADEPTPAPAPSPEQPFEGIILNIPNSPGTRGEDDPVPTFSNPTDGERIVTNIVLLAYDASGTDEENLAKKPAAVRTITQGDGGFDLTMPDYTTSSNNGYNPLPVAIPAGTYHIFVLANIQLGDLKKSDGTTALGLPSEGTTASWENVTMSDLNGAVFNKDLITDTTYGLPMTCGYKAIRSTASTDETSGLGAEFTDGKVTVNARSTTTIYVDLLFTHAKVRYTILNKSVGELAFTKDEKDNEIPVQIQNYREDISAFGHLANNTSVTKKNGYVTDGKFYPYPSSVQTSSDLATANLDNLGTAYTTTSGVVPTTEDGAKLTTWAYQGIVYVPERLFATDDVLNADPAVCIVTDPVKIQFNFNLSAYSKSRVLGNKKTIYGDNDGLDNELNGVVRGVFYDVVGLVQSRQIDLQVRVKNWTYHKSVQDLED